MDSLFSKPVFTFTSDVDWASEAAINDSIDYYRDLGVDVHFFATHESPALRSYASSHPANVGLHPNFLSGSTQGGTPEEIVDGLLKSYPEARSSRSHHFYDSSGVISLLADRGLAYDSNLCLWLQPELRPLHLGAGDMVRYPVFWEDDVHWTRFDGFPSFGDFADRFFSPGLKIINTHPFALYLNIGSESEYAEKKPAICTVYVTQEPDLVNSGYGVRSFIREMLAAIRERRASIMTLDDLHRQLYDAEQNDRSAKGRNTSHTEAELEGYLVADDASKQEFVRLSYEARNAEDIYATSRDYHLRELEISAIRQNLPARPGRALDLGCGNGYTILTLAQDVADWEFTGVDFSGNLIRGAKALRERFSTNLQSKIDFVHADALEYVANLGDSSVDLILTERFVLNLPSWGAQQKFLTEAVRALTGGGTLLLCEGFQEGFRKLNELRVASGLEAVPDKAQDNVSSLKLPRGELQKFLEGVGGLECSKILGFSDFFLISRVVHPLLIYPERPSYENPINRVAREIQQVGELRPGLGSNELWVIRKT